MQRAFLLLLFGLVSIEDAHAYIDPGTASLWVQGILAAVAAVVATVRLYWGKLKSMLGRKKPD